MNLEKIGKRVLAYNHTLFSVPLFKEVSWCVHGTQHLWNVLSLHMEKQC